MTYNVTIYQMDIDNANKFMPYSFAMGHGGINISDYMMTYQTKIVDDRDIYQVLEYIFEIFNIDHPIDYKGHSLSVSDIVELNGDKYYVDVFGFKKI